MPTRKKTESENEVELSSLLSKEGAIALKSGDIVALNGDRIGVLGAVHKGIDPVSRVNVRADNAARLLKSAASQLASGKIEGIILEGLDPELVIKNE